MIEIFVNINLEPYREFYLISTFGRIKSLRKGCKMLKYYPREGYDGVTLYYNEDLKKTYNVHRLVAMTFLDNPKNLPFVNHKDGKKLNNHWCNLEWVTQQENVRHSLDVLGNRSKLVGPSKSLPGIVAPPEGRQHPNYPGYIVTMDARVYSLKSNKFLIVREQVSGYHSVSLSHRGVSKIFGIHILVAETYLVRGEGQTQVNHIDSNKANNCLSNLEFVTPKENMAHRIRTSGKVLKPVMKMDKDGNEIQRYNSVQEAADENKIDQGSISNVCRGKKQVRAGGFYWKFI